MSVNRVCIISNCGAPTKKSGYCCYHYSRWEKHGDALYSRVATICSVYSCELYTRNNATAYCANHNARYKRYGNPLGSKPRKHRTRTTPSFRMEHKSSLGSYGWMINRCNNTNAPDYPYYGGRGIKVCDRWKNSFANFIEDMGDRPDGMTLDRIDPNGDYEPTNCRWATKQVQSINKRPSTKNNTGVRGVSKTRRNNRTYFIASLKINNEIKLSKLFKHIDEAIAARKEAENRYYKPIMDSYET